MDIFLKLHKKEKTKGRDRKLTLCGCSLIASRIIEYPLLLSDFKRVNEGEKKVMNYAKNIAKDLEIQITPAIPEAFVERFGRLLDLPNLTIAMKMIEYGKELDLFGNNAFKTIVAASLLATCRKTKHQTSVSNISRVTGVSEYSILELAKNIIWAVDEKNYERYVNEMVGRE